MSAPDLTRLSPGDAVVAFRSFPRRYASELASIEGDDTIEELAARLGPDGTSCLQIMSDVTRTWSLLDEALRQVLQQDEPVVHPGVADPTERHWDAPPPDSIDDALALLGHEADALADRVESVESATEWSRTARIAGGGSVTALDVVKDGVRTGAEGLEQVRRTLQAVRR